MDSRGWRRGSLPAPYNAGVPDSPLAFVTDEPMLHQFLGYLADVRRRIDAGEEEVELHVHPARVEEISHAFSRMVRSGEERLHQLARLLARSVYGEEFDLRSVVIGQVESTGERFLLQQPIQERLLFGLTDLDLGQRILQRVRFSTADGWHPVQLVANAVEYLPTGESPRGVHKIISRIKAEEEVWNKVVDELFDLDSLVRKDKELRPLSPYVKDVFGLKFVVTSPREARALQQHLVDLRWTRAQLEAGRVTPEDDTFGLKFVETKDYLARSGRKRSDWMAIKSVVQWHGKSFEIQVQPLRNYYRERERATGESHDMHKAQREAVRDEVAARIPLFGFTRDLLKWLFGGRDGDAPSHPRVRLRVED
jgi:hypothetical protein